MESLGQKASKEGDGTIYCLPGVSVDYQAWQQNAVESLRQIAQTGMDGDTFIVVSHGPHLAGLALHVQGISDPGFIKESIPHYRKQEFMLFNVKGDVITGVKE